MSRTAAVKSVQVDTTTGIVSAPFLDAADRIWGAPALGGGVLYVGSLDGKLRAVAPGGAERWSKGVGGAIAGDIAIDGDTVYAGTLESRVVALDTATGDQRWHFDGNNSSWARPLVTSHTVYVATTQGTVYAINLVRTVRSNGKAAPVRSEAHASPGLVGGVLVVADRVRRHLRPEPGGRHGAAAAEARRQALLRWIRWRQESAILHSSHDGTLAAGVRPQDQGASELLFKQGS